MLKTMVIKLTGLECDTFMVYTLPVLSLSQEIPNELEDISVM